MASIDVKATQDVPEDELQRFAAQLRPVLLVDIDDHRAFFRSTVAPSWVHFLQTPEFWRDTVAGGLIWDGIKAIIRDRRAIIEGTQEIAKGAFLDFVVSVALLRERLAPETSMWVGCPIPNDWFSTLMLIRGANPNELAVDLAYFLVHLPALEKFYIEHDGDLTGQITLTVTESGDLSVVWMDNATLTPQLTVFARPDERPER